MSVPRVLIFTTAYKPLIGGSELAIEEVAKRLPDVLFDVITARFPGLKKFESDGNVNIHRIGGKWSLPLLGAVLGLKLTQKHSYVAFHAFQASYGAVAGAILSIFRPATPFVITLQEGKNLPAQNLLVKVVRNLVLRRADKITAISDYLLKFARKINGSADLKKIPNGVDTELYKSAGKTEDGYIITVSRLVPKNAVDLLIRAMQHVDRDLIIVGDGPDRQNLEELAIHLGISDRVKFIGSLENKAVAEYLKGASVFARPSRSEGLGTAFLEAMATGVPVVATPVGGIPDFLVHEETGLLVPPESPIDLADAINRLISDADLNKKITANAQVLVSKNYDWDLIAKQYKEFIYD